VRWQGRLKLPKRVLAAMLSFAAGARRSLPSICKRCRWSGFLAAATLHGIPENLVLGIALGEGSGGIAPLAAIFAANFPKAMVSSASMREQGRSQAFILGTWTICAVLLIFAVVLGAGPLSRAEHETLSLPLAFAAGAVLAALADTLMPEAYEHGGPTVALSTAAGFLPSFVLSLL
jgi:zinc transporter, ZIP family